MSRTENGKAGGESCGRIAATPRTPELHSLARRRHRRLRMALGTRTTSPKSASSLSAARRQTCNMPVSCSTNQEEVREGTRAPSTHPRIRVREEDACRKWLIVPALLRLAPAFHLSSHMAYDRRPPTIRIRKREHRDITCWRAPAPAHRRPFSAPPEVCANSRYACAPRSPSPQFPSPHPRADGPPWRSC